MKLSVAEVWTLVLRFEELVSSKTPYTSYNEKDYKLIPRRQIERSQAYLKKVRGKLEHTEKKSA